MGQREVLTVHEFSVLSYLWVDRYFGSTQKMLSKEANNFDVFFVQYI